VRERSILRRRGEEEKRRRRRLELKIEVVTNINARAALSPGEAGREAESHEGLYQSKCTEGTTRPFQR
jgi:hypothetical protein